MELKAQAKTGGADESRELVCVVRDRLRQHLRGKDEVIDLTLAAFLGGGHILLEGPPGTGKTSLAKALAGAFGGSFRRVQMTSDLLPSDIVGIIRLKPGEREFEFRRGPIFANFLLADELNRTSSKTQSALLEAMAERTVTVDGQTYALPKPFFVIATQNPMEFQGVYPLAESQLDRFMVQLLLDVPEKQDELAIYRQGARAGGSRRAEEILESRTQATGSEAEVPLLTIDRALELQLEAAHVHMEDSVLEYAADLARATRVAKDVSHGVSVRGGLQLVIAARALAFVRGRDFVSPKDVSDLAVPVMAHRLCFRSGEGEAERRRHLIEEILERVRAPR